MGTLSNKFILKNKRFNEKEYFAHTILGYNSSLNFYLITKIKFVLVYSLYDKAWRIQNL